VELLQGEQLFELMTMVLYAFRTNRELVVEAWVKRTNKSLSGTNMLTNPFNGRVKQLGTKEGLVVVVDIRPLYPNFSVFGWMTAVVLFVLFGLSWWLLPCVFIGCLGVFWSNHFYFWVTKKSLRRVLYDGSIKRLSLSDLVREVVM